MPNMSYFFISDLHLGPNTPNETKLLEKFLQNQGSKAQDIFILGDLFEYWVGNDIENSWFSPITKELNRLKDLGVGLFFINGNRDFLINKEFLKINKLKQLPDPYKINLAGQNILLSHGDIFCTNDKSYMRFRRFTQSKILRKIFLSLPTKIRQKIALKFRQTSQNKKDNTELKIMDVNDLTVKKYLKKFNGKILIHGHTHKPNVHNITYDNGISDIIAKRYVLGDWHKDSAIILELNDKGEFELNNLV